eukprot:gnl/TRDRNA2_/TRDRNA2_142240_c0_seq2.p1 gnl/TRDRNA2_/TRDRNA2_142240_c0~~gnl/TRDRNA2_/TRDRNA2_142240_c0_seq2.p1  ORF type:complete len:403 (+),score=56.13 gnl/TRDRNA2_/TRDRNA2_142240_c0_seq2:154-1362(+)
MFAMVLCDSLLRAHKGFGVKPHVLKVNDRLLQTCLCVASGGSLIMGSSSTGRSDSAIELALRALSGGERGAHRLLATDPTVRVVVIRAEKSTTKCRNGNEQFPQVVKDRSNSRLVKSFETPWTICDLEDVVQQRPERYQWPETEACEMRHFAGIYDQPGDDLHFRNDVALEAGDELLRAGLRTASMWYPDLDRGCVLLMLAAGWNVEHATYNKLDKKGHAWRKAELTALAELCALDGHRLSIIESKMRELLRRANGSHSHFLEVHVESIVPICPGQCQSPGNEIRSSGNVSSGHLEGWLRSSRSQQGHGDASSTACQSVGCESASDSVKRKHDVAFFAEMTNLPSSVAEEKLGITNGDVSAALDSFMMQTTRVSSQGSRFSKRLAVCTEVIELSDDEKENQL